MIFFSSINNSFSRLIYNEYCGPDKYRLRYKRIEILTKLIFYDRPLGSTVK